MSETVLTPYVNPNASQTTTDPAVEKASRDLLASYFGPGGLMSQPIPVPTRHSLNIFLFDTLNL